jgi:hypothetical protein
MRSKIYAAPGWRHGPWPGGPHHLLDRAVYELYTSPALLAVARALLPSARRLRSHGDYWLRWPRAVESFRRCLVYFISDYPYKI